MRILACTLVTICSLVEVVSEVQPVVVPYEPQVDVVDLLGEAVLRITEVEGDLLPFATQPPLGSSCFIVPPCAAIPANSSQVS